MTDEQAGSEQRPSTHGRGNATSIKKKALSKPLSREDKERLNHDSKYFWTHIDEFIERFPNKFVAIYKSGVLDSDENPETLRKRIKKQHHIDPNRVFIEIADTPELHAAALQLARSLSDPPSPHRA